MQVKVYNLTLTGNNTFSNNSARFGGGALGVEGGSTLILKGNTFQNNVASVGGAIDAEQCSALVLKGNIFYNNTASEGSGGALATEQSSDLVLKGNIFYNNTASEGSGGALATEQCPALVLKGNIFYNNTASDGGALEASASTLVLIGNVFHNNSATYRGGALFVYASNMTFMNTDFSGNFAEFGGAIFLSDNINVVMLETNRVRKNIATYGGGMYVTKTNISGTATFNNNLAREGGGGIYASGSTFQFKNTSFKNNSAVDGGGLLLSSDSKLYLQPNTQLCFISNDAERNGSAIKVEEHDPITYCNDNPLLDECFFQIQAKKWFPLSHLNITVYFDDNTAAEGSDLHGGSMDTCKLSNSAISSGKVFDGIATGHNKLDTFSNPLYICTCSNNQTNCSSSYHPQPVYPGGTLEIPVTAREQRNGTASANIQVINSNIKIPNIENIQTTNITPTCTTLRYTIQSLPTHSTQEMTLYVQGLCPPTEAINRSNTLKILVDILDCPHGFELHVSQNRSTCVCAKRLQLFTTTCTINNQTVLRAQNAEFWVGYDNESQGLILHPHCPFDYCTSQKTYLAVTDSDRQCNYNRTELLCGRCGKNLSLALGSSRCLQCSNSHLILLAAFAFAGIVLVLLLLVLRLTVAAGTINGLIFYANVVKVNSSIFLKPQKTNVLTVFIAWLNLDLGIETCFYDGMDALMKCGCSLFSPFMCGLW